MLRDGARLGSLFSGQVRGPGLPATTGCPRRARAGPGEGSGAPPVHRSAAADRPGDRPVDPVSRCAATSGGLRRRRLSCARACRAAPAGRL